MDLNGFIQSPAFIIAIAAIAFWLGRITGGPGNDDLEARQMREKMAAEETFLSLSPSKQAEVDRLLMSGKLIEAIKAIRAETGGGLKDSKTIADQRRRQLKGQ